MKHSLPLFLLALLCLMALSFKTGTVLTGKITDDKGEALIGVSIKVLRGVELVRGAISDYNGQYRLELDPGTYDVEFSYTGFETRRITGVNVLDSKVNTLDISLTGGVVLSEVVVTSYKVPLIQKDELSSGMVLSSESIHPTAGHAETRAMRKEMKKKADAKPDKAPAPPPPPPATTKVKEAEKWGDDASYPTLVEESPAEDERAAPLAVTGPGTPAPRAGLLTAGEWNDLHNWNRHWVDLLRDGEINTYEKMYGFFPQNRYSVALQNEQNLPVVDAVVQLTDAKGTMLWETRTDNLGRAELWTNLYEENGRTAGAKIVARVDGKEYKIETAKPVAEGLNHLQVRRECQHPANLDIVWTVDATGSMGDELEYLKTELLDVIGRVKSANPDVAVRMGSVFYRDQGDDYLVKSSALNHDIARTVDYIRKQSAGGGGDYPEAVHSALEEAIYRQPWSTEAVARICFLVLDASPHQEPEVLESLQKSIREAARKGIRIIPVSASGIQKDTEFLLKFFGLATNGTYVFLTDHSGIGGKHLEPTSDEYTVESLNDLLVRLITEYSTVPTCEGKTAIRFEDQAVLPGQQQPGNGQALEPILFYPNPASTQFTVELPFDAEKLTLYDAEGKAVRSFTQMAAGTHTIPVNDLNEGFYTLRIWKNGQVQSGKVVVVRA